MALSRRQKITELLLDVEQPISAPEMARILKIDEENIKQDLPRIAELAKRKGWKLVIVPQRCKKCGREFEPSLHIASKCPSCGSQWLEGPWFKLEK